MFDQKSYHAEWRKRNADKVKRDSKRYHQENKERQCAKTRAWSQANKDRKRNSDREHYEKNKARISDQNRSWRMVNREHVTSGKRVYAEANRALIRERNRLWRQANAGKVLADRAWRKARKRRATPAWLTASQRAEIVAFYECAVLLSRLEGTSYHVDHVVPLGGATVCGLHVPWNLQLLTGAENLQKGNRL